MVVAEWGPYRRALRSADREVFDRMVNHAREYASAGSNLADLDPTVPIMLSIMLAQEAELVLLRRAVEEMRKEGRAGDTG
jgi:hypothetical protein